MQGLERHFWQMHNADNCFSWVVLLWWNRGELLAREMCYWKSLIAPSAVPLLLICPLNPHSLPLTIWISCVTKWLPHRGISAALLPSNGLPTVFFCLVTLLSWFTMIWKVWQCPFQWPLAHMAKPFPWVVVDTQTPWHFVLLKQPPAIIDNSSWFELVSCPSGHNYYLQTFLPAQHLCHFYRSVFGRWVYMLF